MSERGFLTFAHNIGEADYLRHAYGLALSLAASQQDVKKLSVCVPRGTVVPEKYRAVFDHVVEFDSLAGDYGLPGWQVQNKVQAFDLTPYDETVLLDADMLFPVTVDDWWGVLSEHDVRITGKVMTHRDTPVVSDYYRRVFTANHLPNVYTGFMFFKKNPAAAEMFAVAAEITRDWQTYYNELDHAPTYYSGDVTFALAIKMLDKHSAYVPGLDVPTFVHMKTAVLDLDLPPEAPWRDALPVSVTASLNIKVGNYSISRPFHYQDKTILSDAILVKYESVLGV